MPEERRERLPRQFVEEDRDTLNIIAERLRTKGAVTLRDIEVLLRQQHEKTPSTS